MQIGRRNTTIAFVLLGAIGVGLAIALNITWAFHWRSVAAVVLGIVLFGILIAVLTLNTIFLVREIRRSEQHDSFINAVTHELKTPITSIKLYLETLQSRPVEDEQRREFYGVMLEDVGRLLGTVEQVLKAGQVVQSRPLRRLRVDVREVLTECVELARRRHYLPDGQMRLESFAGTDSPRVLGDAEELRFAFSNVLDNAVKYSPPATAVSVGARTEGGRVVIEVRDQGIGIPARDLPRVFERFYRVDKARSRELGGTGLGLAIVRHIAMAHGGEVSVESWEGEGSTFRIFLPL